MNVFCEQDKDITVITVEGPISVPESDKFKEYLAQKIENGFRKILIDCTTVNYIDSSGVSTLLTLLQAVRKKGGDIRLVGLTERNMETIRQVGLHHVFRRFETIGEGLQSFDEAESA